jgi:hypothetical protein
MWTAFAWLRIKPRSRDSAVGTATGYGLDDSRVCSSSPGRVKNFQSPRPDRLWGPPSLLFNGHRWSFPGGKAVGA